MLHLILYQPEIPPNTGNIIRLCANAGARLHLIHPLGFELDDKRARRAGLDYHELANVKEYPDDIAFLNEHSQRRIFACTTKTDKSHCDYTYCDEDMFLFGPETRGLPESLRHQFQTIRIPMLKQSRSLNLANACAIILYEAWRQLDFLGQG
jgi:tRNA (cytidine/uridine-2'-O-)-methyltransferase